MENIVLATIAGVMAISAVATAAEANPWRQFRADQSSAHAAGASGHYWAGVRRGRTVGDNIAKRTLNNSVAGFEYMLVTRDTLTGTLAQRLDAVGEAFRTERYFGQNVRSAVHSVFGATKGGVVDNIYFNLRDGVITSAEAYTRLAAALTIGSDRLTAGGLDVDTATDAQIVAEKNPTVPTVTGPISVNAHGQYDLPSHDATLGAVVDDIRSDGFAIDPTGALVEVATLSDGTVVRNFGNLNEAQQDELEAAGYIVDGVAVGNAVESVIGVAINEAYEDGYNDGYEDGFADGYRVGFDDGVASVR